MARTNIYSGSFFPLAVVLLFGCGNQSTSPVLTAPADSLAWRIAEAHGGLAAWGALPILRFDYVEETDSTEAFRARHLWDRRNDRYRVEWPLHESSPSDSLVVAIFRPSDFDTESPRGSAEAGNVRLQGNKLEDVLREAYRRFVHDSFWVAAPFRLFDSGVRRGLASDSSTADWTALVLSFDDSGVGFADRYWIYADRTSGVVQGWTFRVDSTNHAESFTWNDPAQIQIDDDTLTFLTTKRSPSGRVIRTLVGQPGDAGALLTDLSNRLLPLD